MSAITEYRKANNLTQTAFGEMVGVQAAATPPNVARSRPVGKRPGARRASGQDPQGDGDSEARAATGPIQ